VYKYEAVVWGKDAGTGQSGAGEGGGQLRGGRVAGMPDGQWHDTNLKLMLRHDGLDGLYRYARASIGVLGWRPGQGPPGGGVRAGSGLRAAPRLCLARWLRAVGCAAAMTASSQASSASVVVDK